MKQKVHKLHSGARIYKDSKVRNVCMEPEVYITNCESIFKTLPEAMCRRVVMTFRM